MTSETTKKESDPLERPLSTFEVVRMFALILFMYPVFLGGILSIGAYLHSYPLRPTPWYGFWASVGSLTTVGILSIVFLLDCPRLVRQRTSKVMPGESESSGERIFQKMVSPTVPLAIVGMGYDGSSRRDTFPRPLIWTAIAVFAISMAWVIYVMRSNKYASRIVVVQEGQQLVSTGPYAVVRHPMYMGIIPMFLSLPLTVGAVWPLVPVTLCLVLFGVRTYSEEEFLVKTFGEEYLEYRKKVPYRMIPFVF